MDPFTVALSDLQELMYRLTPRQLEIVELLAKGYTRKQIASILSISHETVKNHISILCRKLEVDNRTQAIVIYVVWKVQTKDENAKPGETKIYTQIH